MQEIKKLGVRPLETRNAEDARWQYRDDQSLPSQADYEALLRNQQMIPPELRPYDLIFPRVISKGIAEGCDQVTDDSIASLVWNGQKWEESYLLAGPRGWARQGPDLFNPRSRLAVWQAN